MFNLLRVDLYRLIRSRYFWVITAIAIAFLIFIAMFVNWIASPEFAQMVNESVAQNEQVSEAALDNGSPSDSGSPNEGDEIASLNSKIMSSFTYDCGQMFFDSSLVGILGSLLAALLILSDFKKGYIKNLPMDNRGRRNYFVEKLIMVAFLQAYLIAVCALTSFLSFLALGFSFEIIEPLGDVALWMFLVWLYSTAMAYLVSCIAWLSRSEGVSSATVLFLSSGILGVIMLQIIGALVNVLPVLGQIPQFLLASVRIELRNGATGLWGMCAGDAFITMPIWAHAIIICIVFSLIAAIISWALCQKRDMA